MKNEFENSGENALGVTAILVHLGLLGFGIAALLSGLAAGDYKKIEHTGFTVHSWIGMAGVFFVLLRAVLGLVGPPDLRFTNWIPCTRKRLLNVREDIGGLFRFRLPDRPTHTGMAGVVQMFGLLVFLLTALSGIFLFFTIEPGHKSRGLIHTVKEFHEMGLFLITFFLSMHIGAVAMHALNGRHHWRKIFFLKELTADPQNKMFGQVVEQNENPNR